MLMSVIVLVHVAQIFLRAPVPVGRFLSAPVSTCVQFSGFACAIKLSYIINLAWDKSRSGLSAAAERQIISRQNITNVCQVVADFLFSPHPRRMRPRARPVVLCNIKRG